MEQLFLYTSLENVKCFSTFEKVLLLVHRVKFILDSDDKNTISMPHTPRDTGSMINIKLHTYAVIEVKSLTGPMVTL